MLSEITVYQLFQGVQHFYRLSACGFDFDFMAFEHCEEQKFHRTGAGYGTLAPSQVGHLHIGVVLPDRFHELRQRPGMQSGIMKDSRLDLRHASPPLRTG